MTATRDSKAAAPPAAAPAPSQQQAPSAPASGSAQRASARGAARDPQALVPPPPPPDRKRQGPVENVPWVAQIAKVENDAKAAVVLARDDAKDGAQQLAIEGKEILRKALEAQVLGILSGDAKLVKRIQDAGEKSAKAQLGKVADVGSDLTSHAADVFAKSGAKNAMLETESKTRVEPTLGRAPLLDAAKAGFDNGIGKGKADAEVAAARVRAKGKVDQQVATSTKDLGKELAAALKPASARDAIGAGFEAKMDKREDLTKAVENEGKQRTAKKDLVVTDALAGEVKASSKRMVASLGKEIADKLGAGGVGLLSSGALKNFHAAMMAAGKKQAKDDALEASKKDDKATAEQHADAVKRAEASSDKAATQGIVDLSNDGATEIVKEVAPSEALTKVATAAAWAEVRNDKKADDAIKKSLVANELTLKPTLSTKGEAFKEKYLGAKRKEDDLKVATAKAAAAVKGAKVGETAATDSGKQKGNVQELVRLHSLPAKDGVIGDLKVLLEKHIGANGAGYFTANDIRDFRKRIKGAARTQAYGKIDAEVEKQAKGDATKAYTKVAARDVAYDKAKESVNAELKLIASEQASNAFSDAKMAEKIAAAARTAAFEALRLGKDEKAAMQAVSSDFSAKKTGYVAELNNASAAWIAELLKAPDDNKKQAQKAAAPQPQPVAAPAKDPNARKMPDAKDRVEKKVEADKVAEKSVTRAIQANTTTEGLGLVGQICDMAVPDRGDSCKIDIEIRVPTGDGLSYVVIRLVGEAERGVTTRQDAGGALDQRSLKVGAQFSLGGGIDLHGFRMDGSLGFFIRAQGADTQKTFQILSYGAYRAACGIHDSIGNWWSGTSKAQDAKSGGHGKKDTERAELWAAMVEENAFMRKDEKTGKQVNDDDAFVEYGAMAQARAKLKTNVFDAEGSAKYENFKRLDASIIKTALGKGDGKQPSTADLAKPVASEDEAKSRRKLINQNVERKEAGVFEVKVTASIMDQKVEFAGKLEKGENGKWGVEIAAAVKFDSSNTSSSMLENFGAAFATSSASALRTLVGVGTREREDAKDPQTSGARARRHVGSLIDAGNDAENMVTAATGGSTAWMSKEYLVNSEKADGVNDWSSVLGGKSPDADTGTRAGTSSEVNLQVVLNFDSEGTKTLTVKQVKVRKLSIGMGPAMLDAQLERQKRIALLGTTGGALQGELLGGTARGEAS